jgi:two-component system nitrogen regulation sensor histidine kinase NtrY
MGFKRFSLLLTVRLFFLMLSLALLGYLLTVPGFHAATLLVLSAAIAQSFELLRFVSRTNQELARFLDAARYADVGQRFNFSSMGSGFAELGDTFTKILDRFQVERQQQETDLRYLKILVEQVPGPLISIHSDNRISLLNNAARRLFGLVQIVSTDDLAQFGENFREELETLKAGDKRLVTFVSDNMEQRLSLSATDIIANGKAERLISLVNIKSELDSSQLEAWQDLVRVLTHEIMNSITPIASLSKTAADLVTDARGQEELSVPLGEALEDVQDAVDTLARRSEGLMGFVGSYRQLTRLAPPHKSQFRLDAFFEDVKRIATQGWQEKSISLLCTVEPAELDLYADRNLIEQVLINILQNSEHALESTLIGEVSLSASLNKRGHVIIEICDNGPGVPETIGRKIFVPFYTTKREGSGVGLALSRQVMIAHEGAITMINNDGGGARCTLIF